MPKRRGYSNSKTHKKKIPEKKLEKKTEIPEKSLKSIPFKEKEIKTTNTVNTKVKKTRSTKQTNNNK